MLGIPISGNIALLRLVLFSREITFSLELFIEIVRSRKYYVWKEENFHTDSLKF
jgi:hypothetical protein